MIRHSGICFLFFLAALAISCSSSKRFTRNYYSENEVVLQKVLHLFEKLYEKNPFALEIVDRRFSRINLEIHTDTVKYIYNFNLPEPFLIDTLRKYGFDTRDMNGLLQGMETAHIAWISKLDYYEDEQLKFLVFLSVRDRKLTALLRSEKYFTIVFFKEAQPYDVRGRLLDRDDLEKNRLINGEVYRRVTDSVFYALSGRFR